MKIKINKPKIILYKVVRIMISRTKEKSLIIILTLINQVFHNSNSNSNRINNNCKEDQIILD